MNTCVSRLYMNDRIINIENMCTIACTHISRGKKKLAKKHVYNWYTHFTGKKKQTKKEMCIQLVVCMFPGVVVGGHEQGETQAQEHMVGP
jgi:hypothetical protein